ncbi:creatininase family protein [Lentilitoribacter sp. EG35]|uniref:creatininase family protein n=1 Tax=Lentilitoribacter sp. EG35 TaxID=3234192 RepID=UPI00345F782B
MTRYLINLIKTWHDIQMKTTDHETIVIIPFGAYEQHGAHLPSDTDAIIATELARRLGDVVDKLKIKLLPTEQIGYSIEHLDFGKTKSFSYQKAIERWLGIIKQQYDLGHRKILLLNAHGGNSPLLTIVATEARVKWNMLVVVTHWTRFGLPDELADKMDKSIDIHAGDIETSIMLSINSDLVNMKYTENFPSKQSVYIDNYKFLRAYGPHAFGWKMSDLNDQGVVGNASSATAEKGNLILEHTISGLKDLVTDISQFDLAQFR